MKLRRIAYILYPLLIGLLVPTLFYAAIRTESKARAGQIRKTEISPDRPLIVHLAQGRTTAISFSVRPEKVVPGNPQALEINFLGKDLTLRPLGAHPGNLIVYTKSGRFVILLEISHETSYDDVVSVTGFSASRLIHLLDDSYRLEQFKMTSNDTKKEEPFNGQVRHMGSVLQTQELPHDLRCKGCLVQVKEDATEIVCLGEIIHLECQHSGKRFTIERVKS